MDCPKCSQEMKIVKIKHANGTDDVELDVCDAHGIWFDKGELWDTVKVARKDRAKKNKTTAKQSQKMVSRRLMDMCSRASDRRLKRC